MKTKISLRKFESLIEALVGLPINFVWKGYGSAIFLEFGKLTKNKKQNHPQGEFSVMLDCEWRIEKSRSIFFGSSSGLKRIENQISKLLNERVQSIHLLGLLPEIQICLSRSLRIVSFCTSEGQPDWTIFLPNKSYIYCRGGCLIFEEKQKNNENRI